MARETHAACIALREREGAREVCIVEQEGQGALPSAALAKGEIPKQTALRALHEASGVQATLAQVDPRFYRTSEHVFRKGIDKVRRETHYYLVRVGPEAAAGTWVPEKEAPERVASKAMREALEAALRG
jgi:hypothetical protein